MVYFLLQIVQNTLNLETNVLYDELLCRNKSLFLDKVWFDRCSKYCKRTNDNINKIQVRSHRGYECVGGWARQ